MVDPSWHDDERRNGQIVHDAPHVRESRGGDGRRAGRDGDGGAGSGRAERRRVGERGRGQAHSLVLPRMRQDGVRRVGDRARRKGREDGGRRERVPVGWQPLRERAGVASGGLPSRPAALSPEAHEAEGRGSRVGAHHLGRGVPADGRRHPRQPGEVRQGDVHLHGRHVAHLVDGALRGFQTVLRLSERHPGERDLQRPALLRDHAQRVERVQLDGGRGPSAGVRAVGRRVRAVELRRLVPHDRRGGDARRQAHHRRPAPDEPGQGGRHLGEPASRHRRRRGELLGPGDHRERPHRRSVRAQVDERADARG